MPRAALVLLALLPLAACGAERRPNVVLVLLDTLRPDHLELYGYERETAPWIDALGERGAVFTRAFSTSAWTPPATASTLTGLYPTRHGVVHGFETNARLERRIARGVDVKLSLVKLPPAHPTLAERFRAAGYATFGATTNVHIGSPLGFDRGFDRFVHELNADAARVRELVGGFGLPDDRPWFLYLHLNDVHRPNEPRAPWYEPSDDRAEDLVRRYDSEISFADAQLARTAAEQGWDERTLVCLVSDHGEGFGENGVHGHGPTLHGVVNRVLMAVAGPGVPPARIDANVSLVDVYPTLLELAGLPAAQGVDGVSLAPLFREASAASARARLDERTLFAHRRARFTPISFLWGAVRGDWKLVLDEETGAVELYDLAHDFAELSDVSEREPARVAELSRLREEFARTSTPLGEAVEIELDGELSEHLRQVGYVGD